MRKLKLLMQLSHGGHVGGPVLLAYNKKQK